MGIVVVNPTKTLPLSITGTKCALQCDHCKAHYLKGMVPLEKLKEKLNGYKSVLISGGFDLEGKLPYIPKDYLLDLKEKRLKLNYHLGLIEEKEIEEIRELIDEISFDLILDEIVIKKIFHLEKTPEDYKKTFKFLRDNFSISPHLVLGINYGKIEKEYEAIEFLKDFKIDKVIFIIFNPLKSTPMENFSPPNLDSLKKFFDFARENLRKTKFYLGCVRPGGEYRKKVDFLAYEYGFKAIVNPHYELLKYLEKKEEIEGYFEECCSLLK